MEAYQNNEASGNPNKSAFFNRSLTARSNPQSNPYFNVLNRVGSIKVQSDSKLYNSIESVVSASSSIKGKVKKLCSIFESARIQSSGTGSTQLLSPNRSQLQSPKLDCGGTDKKVSIRLQGTEDRIVVYFTSLRGVRRTFEDCYAVRMIFKGFRVWVDERDLSMDSVYRKELQSVMGQKIVSLPQVFIRGELVGGAETIKSMFETGELAKMLQGFPKQKPGFVCESCGDVRFVPCRDCNGSRKVFDEDEGILKRCLDCNENGLIRCPDCCI